MSDPKPNETETTTHKEADMALNTMKTPEAATPIYHGTATIKFNGLTVQVGFDIHAEAPLHQKEELIRKAAVQCVTNFFDTYRNSQPEAGFENGEAA